MCPKCGGPVHRSRTRGFSEKLVKTLTANRTYRCFDCGWRGWLETTDIPQLIESRRRRFLRTIISVLVTILVTALLALYLVRKTQASGLPVSSRKTSQQEALLEKGAARSNSDRVSLALIQSRVFCNNGCPEGSSTYDAPALLIP